MIAERKVHRRLILVERNQTPLCVFCLLMLAVSACSADDIEGAQESPADSSSCKMDAKRNSAHRNDIKGTKKFW
jgi:hypothetical protein